MRPYVILGPSVVILALFVGALCVVGGGKRAIDPPINVSCGPVGRC